MRERENKLKEKKKERNLIFSSAHTFLVCTVHRRKARRLIGRAEHCRWVIGDEKEVEREGGCRGRRGGRRGSWVTPNSQPGVPASRFT